MRHACLLIFALVLACTSPRRFYLESELATLEGDPRLTVGPGPWPSVPVVFSDPTHVPDDLVLPTLKALMALPGAADACDLNGQPRPGAAEYCVAVYRTPEDWRVTWPIRKLVGAHSSCKPPFGGVEDADFGRDLPVFGYAHNHPCGLFASSRDLTIFPTGKSPSGAWMVVGHGITPSGEPARDAQGQLLAAWAWLATGHMNEPRFYKWSPAGDVFRWSADRQQWEFQAVCRPQSSNMLNRKPLPPECAPELINWF